MYTNGPCHIKRFVPHVQNCFILLDVKLFELHRRNIRKPTQFVAGSFRLIHTLLNQKMSLYLGRLNNIAWNSSSRVKQNIQRWRQTFYSNTRALWWVEKSESNENSQCRCCTSLEVSILVSRKIQISGRRNN